MRQAVERILEVSGSTRNMVPNMHRAVYEWGMDKEQEDRKRLIILLPFQLARSLPEWMKSKAYYTELGDFYYHNNMLSNAADLYAFDTLPLSGSAVLGQPLRLDCCAGTRTSLPIS